MEKAIAYIRVSSQRQVDEGGSLESQTKQVKQFASSHGYDLIQIFREEGESAKSDRRPELQRMLKFCSEKQNRVQIVIVPKIDRLSRNVHDYFNLKIQLSRRGVRVESLGERIEDTPSGRLTETMFASMAQFDNEIRAERCKGGMTEAVSEGRWVWKAPVGYRNVRLHGRGNIEPDPHFAPIVRHAFELFVDGHQSSNMVREYLEKEGVRLSRSSFYKLIQNEVYIGRIHAFGKVVTAKEPFVPIVDETLFYRAQSCLKRVATPQTYQKESEDFPLRGAMRCDCGTPFTAYWARSATGAKYAYFRCIRCPRRNFRRSQVESDFLEHLAQFEYEPTAWDRVTDWLRNWETLTTTAVEAQAQSAAEKVLELKKLRDNIILKNANGVIPDDLAKEQIERIGGEIAEAVAQSSEAMPTSNSVDELVSFAKHFLTNLRVTWGFLSLQTKKNLLRFMYPDGALYLPIDGFRTQQIGLPKPLKQVLDGATSGLVDPRNEISNSLHEWLATLYEIGSVEVEAPIRANRSPKSQDRMTRERSSTVPSSPWKNSRAETPSSKASRKHMSGRS